MPPSDAHFPLLRWAVLLPLYTHCDRSWSSEKCVFWVVSIECDSPPALPQEIVMRSPFWITFSALICIEILNAAYIYIYIVNRILCFFRCLCHAFRLAAQRNVLPYAFWQLSKVEKHISNTILIQRARAVILHLLCCIGVLAKRCWQNVRRLPKSVVTSCSRLSGGPYIDCAI